MFLYTPKVNFWTFTMDDFVEQRILHQILFKERIILGLILNVADSNLIMAQKTYISGTSLKRAKKAC